MSDYLGLKERTDILRARAEKVGVNTDIGDRWEKGIEHHPKSQEVADALDTIDWTFGNDFFGWKFGGDGDNGEFLLYELDIYFEILDAETGINGLQG